MPQFRVLESSGGITVDALVTVDANSHRFTPRLQPFVAEIADPLSQSGKSVRSTARDWLETICGEVHQTLLDVASDDENKRTEQRGEDRNRWFSDGKIEGKAEADEALAAAAQQLVACNAEHDKIVAAAKAEGAASRDDEVTKLSETVLALQKELRQIKADAEFQQAADEARRVAQNQARKARRAKAAAAAKAKPTNKRK